MLKLTFIISFLLYYQYISSQILISENAIFAIAPNTIFASNSDITNNGILSNDGSIELTGNWDNNGIYDEMQGKIVLNSTELQYFSHNNQRVSILEIYGSEKIINENVSISNTLNLNRGLVTPDNNVNIIMGANAQINSASDLSYINGILYHTGTGNKLYPIGKNGHYVPVELIHIEGSNSIIGLEMFEPNPNPLAGLGIKKVLTERYWRKTILTGYVDNVQIKYEQPGLFALGNYQSIVFVQSRQPGGLFSNIGAENYSGSLVSRLAFSDTIAALAELDDLQIINVITPNNDGINDLLTITNLELYPENELIVLNMLGQMVFTVKNYTNSWDGTVNNKALPQGNYMCILKLKGTDKVYKQTVSIVR